MGLGLDAGESHTKTQMLPSMACAHTHTHAAVRSQGQDTNTTSRYEPRNKHIYISVNDEINRICNFEASVA